MISQAERTHQMETPSIVLTKMVHYPNTYTNTGSCRHFTFTNGRLQVLDDTTEIDVDDQYDYIQIVPSSHWWSR